MCRIKLNNCRMRYVKKIKYKKITFYAEVYRVILTWGQKYSTINEKSFADVLK